MLLILDKKKVAVWVLCPLGEAQRASSMPRLPLKDCREVPHLYDSNFTHKYFLYLHRLMVLSFFGTAMTNAEMQLLMWGVLTHLNIEYLSTLIKILFDDTILQNVKQESIVLTPVTHILKQTLCTCTVF